nr:competence protein CoiA family protein [Moraxella sp.]
MTMSVALDKTNKLISIEHAERGLACDCFCFECGEPVLAKKGEKNEHHFAHVSNKESCFINPESILHKFAKQVIIEANGLLLPALPNSQETEAKLWQFSQITPEVRFGNIQPDLMVMVDNESYFIEIAVTSFVDEVKLERIKNIGTSTIELDLRELLKSGIAVPSDEAKDFILNNLEHKRWLYPIAQVQGEEDKVVSNNQTSTICRNQSINEQSATMPSESSGKSYQSYLFTIQGMWIDVKAFESGMLAVKSVSYNHEIKEMLKAWSREGRGRFSDQYKTWNYFKPFSATVLERLIALDETPKQ